MSKQADRGASMSGLRSAMCICALALVAAFAPKAEARPPQTDLIVEVRLADGTEHDLTSSDGQTLHSSSTTGTAVTSRRPQTDMPVNHSLRILNGTRGSLRFSRAMPFQWVMAASGRAPSGGESAGAAGGAIVNTLSLLKAGHELSILPLWPGGEAPATVRIELDIRHVDDKLGAEIPGSSNEHLETIVVSALGRWTTFAVLGSADDSSERHSLSSNPARLRESHLLQLRVTRPGI